MSQRNVEIVRRIYATVAERRDPPPELLTPDSEFDMTDVAPDVAGTMRASEWVEALRSYHETFAEFKTELEEVIHEDPGRVVTAIRDGGRVKGSDTEISNRFFHVFTFRGGRIARLSAHTDRNRALAAAGLQR